MIASLRIPSVIGALGDVDRGTWVKACLGVGATAVLLRLVKARLEKKSEKPREESEVIRVRLEAYGSKS